MFLELGNTFQVLGYQGLFASLPKSGFLSFLDLGVKTLFCLKFHEINCIFLFDFKTELVYYYELCVDLLLAKAFDVMKSAFNKHELRHLMNKFRFPEEKVQELETTYHGKDQLVNRYCRSMF